MGVSLERVQFKFASIIGELCSDPDVLSQFAVWLDLRLAEYKLKGAISLDCSGEEPDPVWLKGLNKGKKTSVAAQRDRIMAASGPIHGRSSLSQRTTSPAKDIPESHSQAMPSADLLNRLSPDDIVVVKDEPSDVYPVELHVHESLDSSFVGRRKRSAAETVSREHWSHDPSSGSPKHRRISSTAESPSNQSLMSVIGGFKDKQESELKGDNSVLSAVSDADLHGSAALASRSTVDPQADLSADFMDTTLNNSQSTQDISWMNQSGMSGEQSGFGVEQWRRGTTAPSHHQMAQCATTMSHPSVNFHRRKKMANTEGLPKVSVSNMVVAARIVEEWLWSQHSYSEARSIEEIEPEKLDKYLANFFRTIKRPDGENYKRRSFGNLRTNLGRYLKQTGYAQSIISSPLFKESQMAFQTRSRLLPDGIPTQYQHAYCGVLTPETH